MPRAAIALFCLALPAFSAPQARNSNPGSVLSELTIANFSSAGQTTIHALATDSSGNAYMTGTTDSPNFPVKNAAQPTIGEARVLRSADLGVTWTKLGLPPSDVVTIAPDPLNPQILFAAGNVGIFKSIDGGQTWATVYPFPSGYAFGGGLVVDPGDDLRVAALLPSNNTLIYSLDGGNTWSNGGKTCPISGCGGGALIADPTGSGTLIAGSMLALYISRDWGKTFQEIVTGIPGSPTIAAFDPSNPGWIYVDTTAGSTGKLALSKDFGATFTAKASPSTIFSAMTGLQVDPDQPNVLVAATPEGLYKSTDGANTWTTQSETGFSPNPESPFVLVNHQCNAGGGLFAIDESISFSPDDGNTFQTPQLSSITDVAIGPNCAAYVTRATTSSTNAFVAKLSADGAVQWATYLGGSDADSAVALAVDQQGNVIVTGNALSSDFPTTLPRIGVPGSSAVFVTKYTPNGTIAFSTTLGGSSANAPLALAVDLSGNVYVSGRTNSTNFPLTPGVLFNTISAGAYTGFLSKLSSSGALVYSTLLGTSYAPAILVDQNNQAVLAGTGVGPGLPSPSATNAASMWVATLNQTATAVVAAAYPATFNPYSVPTSIAMDSEGNLLIYGSTEGGVFTATPGAYSSPTPPGYCSSANFDTETDDGAFLLKLNASTFQTIYGALFSANCGITPGALAVDSSGSALLAMSTGGDLALRGPVLAGPACTTNSNAVVKLSADGSTLQFATYLDGCGVPGIALASDGSLFASDGTGVLHISTTAPAVSLDQIANTFSGEQSAVAAGGLYTLTGTGFPNVKANNLGLNQNLPTELEGIRVLFDGEPAPIMSVSPTQITIAAPARLTRPVRGEAPPKFTSIQIPGAKPVWMPIRSSLPGLMTTVQNRDGTINSASNPAAVGSTITLYATGMGATMPSVNPGFVAKTSAVTPDTGVYATWRNFTLDGPNPPETVESIPGFVSAMFQIPLQVVAPGSGNIFNVGLQLEIDFDSYIPPASNVIAVYVK